MASSSSANQIIKIEDSPEPLCNHSPAEVSAPPATTPSAAPSVIADLQDPEGFLKRCSGYNKKTKLRCGATIGKNAKNTHPTFLPTCHAHKEQQSFAGWCQFMQTDGERCGRLFRWTPPYFELCEEHQGHPDTPCHFMGLPLELRQEIFRHLLPTQPIGSSSSPLHQNPSLTLLSPITSIHPIGPTSRRAGSHSMFQASPPAGNRLFPFPILDLLLVSQRMYDEVKDFLYSSVPFTIDIRKDGTFMCGRRLLEPRRPDGSAHFIIDDAENVARKFTNTFDFAAVKNYNVDILVENCIDDGGVGYQPNLSWDEEVEMYDIRDYCGVVVSGILSKARNLHKLNVRLGLSKFDWKEDKLLANVKCLVGPFERLRNVRQPKLCGVFDGFTQPNFMINVSSPLRPGAPVDSNQSFTLCSVPMLPTHTSLIVPGDPSFDTYKQGWEKLISKISNSLPTKPPIRAMFTEFKQFYTKLSAIVPAVMDRSGRHAFLHRARVARENENVEAFRHLRNELIHYWYLYIEKEAQRKRDMEAHMSRMLDSDIYPSSEMESVSPRASPGWNSAPVTAETDLHLGNRRSEKRKRASRDIDPVLRHSDFAEAGPSDTASPQMLQHNHTMALNPPTKPASFARIRQAQHSAQARAEAQAQTQVAAERAHLMIVARAQAIINAKAMRGPSNYQSTDNPGFSEMDMEESAAQAQHSAFHPGVSQPQAIIVPNIPSQQDTKPVATASGSNVSNSSSHIPVNPLSRSSSSSSSSNGTSSSTPDLDPPEGWHDKRGRSLQNTQPPASLAQLAYQRQQQQQILHQQFIYQQQRQQALQVQQYQAQQPYHYGEGPHSDITTAHMMPGEHQQALRDVMQNCMQGQSDSSATVSPMTTHSAIPSGGPGFIMQTNGNSSNAAIIHNSYSHAGTKTQLYNGNYNYHAPALDAAPSSKKRRIDSGISVGDETQAEYGTPFEQDVMLAQPAEQGRDISHHHNLPSSIPYVGKGKGRAIEVEEPVEEPSEVVWLD